MTKSSTDAFHALVQPIIGGEGAERSQPLDAAIMSALLRYTAFAELENERPDPFDDPYVGAALFTDDYRLIGAYRKQEAGERHSEPQAVVEALRAHGGSGAARIVAKIDRAYAEKMWLRVDRQPAFEALFKEAGDLLRDALGASSLVMFSSLEPCGKYEAQPSCANILCACHVGRVLYASDDVNPKGMGRPVLLAHGMEVTSNTMPTEAVALNNAFFAAAEICNQTYQDYAYGRLFAGAPYAVFPDGGKLFTADVGPNDRLIVRATTPFGIDHVGPELSVISPYITSREIDAFKALPVERDVTFFYGGRSLGELTKVLYQRAKIVHTLPARIITPDNPFHNDGLTREQKEVSDALLDRLSIKQNAFRKHHEVWTANRNLILANFRAELREFISILIKVSPDPDREPDSASTYRSLFGPPSALAAELERECQAIETTGGYAARITLLANATAVPKDLIAELRQKARTFRPFGRATFEVRLLAQPGAVSAELATTLLRQEVAGYGEIILDILEPQNFGSKHTARQLEQEIRAGRRDAMFFDADYLDSLSSSLDWTERKYAGAIGGRLASSIPDYAKSTLLRGLETLARQGLEGHWAETCTKLNAVRNAAQALAARHRPEAIKALESVADAITSHLGSPPAWLNDVIWRWLACWFEFADVEDREPPAAMAARVCSDDFLLASAVQYAFRSSYPFALESLSRILKGHTLTPLAKTSASATAARLVAQAEGSGAGLTAWPQDLIAQGEDHGFRQELRRCRRARSAELAGFVRMAARRPRQDGPEFPPATQAYLRSYVAMRALSGELGGSAPEIPATGAFGAKSWREDHRSILADVLSFIPAAWRPATLRALARDSDISIRWATVFLTLNDPAVAAVFGPETPASATRLADLRADVVRFARMAGSHYWLEREILRAFLDHHGRTPSPRQSAGDGAMPSARRLGLGAYLWGQSATIHPEIVPLIHDLKKHCSRILLVLPPITWPAAASPDGALAHEGTPPMGLGQIAASLASRGHYVEILDAHRYAQTCDAVALHAVRFDLVGLSTVFSTLGSAQALAVSITRKSSSGPRPRLVIGGHAATLNPQQIFKSSTPFDYLVIGPGEEAFCEIASAVRDGRAIASPYVSAASLPPVIKGGGALRRAAANAFQDVWDSLPLVDRTAFVAPDGTSYEPALTRNGVDLEAHFVMSKGCDWSCTFCTEAIIGGPRETRRAAASAVAEVRAVCEATEARCVQFIDDNVFPPLAAPGLTQQDRQSRLEWAADFLTGMGAIRQAYRHGQRRFSWRGLMRLEDLVAYRANSPRWIDTLAGSGCGLLAFGLEHGDESVRLALKGGDGAGIANDEIATLVRELRDAGIRTKAYFMIGGPHDSPALAERTIDFALSSGVDLAYFAIYKDFRGLAARASKTDGPAAEPRFREFAFDLGTLLAKEPNAADWRRLFGDELRSDPERYRAALAELTPLGFKFSTLFKYSDYHSESDKAALYFADDGGLDPYFKILRRAYLEFYAREAWVATYRELLAHGY